jgi:hypothetical protein
MYPFQITGQLMSGAPGLAPNVGRTGTGGEPSEHTRPDKAGPETSIASSRPLPMLTKTEPSVVRPRSGCGGARAAMNLEINTPRKRLTFSYRNDSHNSRKSGCVVDSYDALTRNLMVVPDMQLRYKRP